MSFKLLSNDVSKRGCFKLSNSKYLKHGASPWFITYMALILLILPILNELANLLSGNIAAKVYFNFSLALAQTESSFTTDFDVQITSAFKVSDFVTHISRVCFFLL